MTGALLILACIAAWFAINLLIGMALFGDIIDAIKGTLFITFGLALLAGLIALFAATVAHFGGTQ